MLVDKLFQCLDIFKLRKPAFWYLMFQEGDFVFLERRRPLLRLFEDPEHILLGKASLLQELADVQLLTPGYLEEVDFQNRV